MTTFTSNLRVLRETRHLNQSDLASSLGISIPAYSKIETGITDINYSRLAKLAEIYQINVAELFCLGQPPVNRSVIDDLAAKLLQRQQEINALQKTAIELYQAIKEKTKY